MTIYFGPDWLFLLGFFICLVVTYFRSPTGDGGNWCPDTRTIVLFFAIPFWTLVWLALYAVYLWIQVYG